MAELPTDEGGENLKAWLAKTPEEAIEPGQPIIDPHHHLWDRRPRRDLPPGTRTHQRYLADDLIEDIRGGGHNVTDTVFIECRAMYRAGNEPRAPVGETEFVQGVAAMAASGLYGEGVRCCSAIVGFADLTTGAAVEDVLRAHMAAGANFRGIRHAHGWHASPDIPNSHHPTRDIQGLLGRDDFRAGFAMLDRLGLSFDCWGYHTQLAEVADLANAFPSTTIVLNHIGGPMAMGPYAGQREGQVFEDWQRAVVPLAECPNIVVKLGGCGMPSYGFGHETLDAPPDSERLARDWRPYFATLIEAFGAERCMFESNFPVDKVSCSYTSLWNAFKRIADDLGIAGKARNDLFYGTAARAYRIALTEELNAGISTPAPAPGERYAKALALLDCFQEARYEDMLQYFAPGAVTCVHMGPYAGRETAVSEKTVTYMKSNNPPCVYADRRQSFAGDRFVEQHNVIWPAVPERSGQSIETVLVIGLDPEGRVKRIDEYGDPATLTQGQSGSS